MRASQVQVPPLVWPLAAVVGVLLALCIGVGARLETGYPPGVPPKPFARLLGQPAPAFVLTGLDGQPISPQAMRDQGEWLLFFTNAGCGACEAAYPALKRAAGYLPVLVVGIGDREVLTAKLAQHELAVPVAYDSLGQVGPLYQVHNYPSALLIDARGLVVRGAVGSLSIEQVLAGRPAAGQGGAGAAQG